MKASFFSALFLVATSFVAAGQSEPWQDPTIVEEHRLPMRASFTTDQEARLEDLHLVADKDGHLSVDAFVCGGVSAVRFALTDVDGKVVASGESTVSKGVASFSATVSGVRLWSAELPYLYTLKAEALARGKVSESTSIDVGFRSVEVVGNQLLVNGEPVLIKGVNRHELSPFGVHVKSAGLFLWSKLL